MIPDASSTNINRFWETNKSMKDEKLLWTERKKKNKKKKTIGREFVEEKVDRLLQLKTTGYKKLTRGQLNKPNWEELIERDRTMSPQFQREGKRNYNPEAKRKILNLDEGQHKKQMNKSQIALQSPLEMTLATPVPRELWGWNRLTANKSDDEETIFFFFLNISFLQCTEVSNRKVEHSQIKGIKN